MKYLNDLCELGRRTLGSSYAPYGPDNLYEPRIYRIGNMISLQSAIGAVSLEAWATFGKRNPFDHFFD